jgi:hypothetical protein
MEVITIKRCGRCKDMLPISAFATDNAARDGFKYACRECLGKQAKERYERLKAQGKQTRNIIAKRPRNTEPLWPLPTHTLTEGLDCVRLRNWRGPVTLPMWGAM